MPFQACVTRVANPCRDLARTCSGFMSSSWVLEMPVSKGLAMSCGKNGPAIVPSWSARLLKVLGIVCIAYEPPCSDEACIAFRDHSRRHRALGLPHSCAGQTFGHARTCPIIGQGCLPLLGRNPEELFPSSHPRREGICLYPGVIGKMASRGPQRVTRVASLDLALGMDDEPRI